MYWNNAWLRPMRIRLRRNPGKPSGLDFVESMQPTSWRRLDVLTLGVLGVLALGLLDCGLLAVRERSRRQACAEQVRRLGVALQSFHERKGTYPPAYVSNLAANGVELGPGWGWPAFLLGDLGQGELFLQLDFARDVREAVVPDLTALFRCPSSAGPTVHRVSERFQEEAWTVPAASYLAVNGNLPVREAVGKNDGVFLRNKPLRAADVTDGLSNTLFLGERRTELLPASWLGSIPRIVLPRDRTEPPDYGMALVAANCGTHLPNQPQRGNRAGFGGNHGAVTPFLFGDGSVRWLADDIKPHVYAALASRASGDRTTEELQ